jgi:hypothetical protein
VDAGDVAHGGRWRRGARRTLETRRAADAEDAALCGDLCTWTSSVTYELAEGACRINKRHKSGAG